MATYRGMDVPDHLRDVLPHMRLVEETREALQILGQQWDLLDVLSRVVETGTEVDKTRGDFQALNAALIAALGHESLNKLVGALEAKAQVNVDIVIRNLFERTADIGFLATDDDLGRFLKGEARPSPDEVRARLIEYRDKYSVYENVVVLDAEGRLRAQAAQGTLPAICGDAWVGRALASDSYVETFAPSDLRPDGEPALTYASRIVEPGPAAAPLGVLALVFRFGDELDGVFRKLLAPDDWTVLALLDADGRVLACSDIVQVPVASRLKVDTNKEYEFIKHAGRHYIAVTRATKGYQGYFGPGWQGCALVPAEVAFEEGARIVLTDRHYRAIAGNTRLFSETVRQIPRRADAIQAELNRTVWNGKLAMSRMSGAADSAVDNAVARRTLLSEISAAGSRTQQVFADAVGTLNRTAIGSLIENCAFSAALAVDLMDRNLYERANDCRWWALTTRFREILTQGEITAAARNEMTAILVQINALYTVYTNLILFDRQGMIQAVSDPHQAELIDSILPRELAHRFTARADTVFYGVSDFEASPLYDGRATYIYGAPVLTASDTRVVGGIAIVFDAEPQLRAMLDDASLFQTAGRLVPGSRNLFVDGQRRIIASTAAEDVIGTELELPADLFVDAAGRPSARVLAVAGELFAVGVGASVGYREYKGPSDAYKNQVFAVSLLPLGADDTQVTAYPLGTRALPVAPPARHNASRREFATFALCDTRFAFDRDETVEAILPAHIVPAPNTSACVAGYTLYQGESIVVLDARAYLGFPAPAMQDAARPVIVFRGRGRLVGLDVDGLGEILDVDADLVGQPGIGDEQQIVKGVVNLAPNAGETMLLVLGADALVQALLSPPALADAKHRSPQ